MKSEPPEHPPESSPEEAPLGEGAFAEGEVSSSEDWLGSTFFALLFVSTVLALGYVLRGFLADFVIGAILVGLVRRPFDWLKPRVGSRPAVAAGLITLLVLITILGPIVGLGYQLGVEGAKVASSIKDLSLQDHSLLDTAVAFSERLGLSVSSTRLAGLLDQVTSSAREALMETGGGILGGAIGLVVHLATVLVVVFYLLVDGKRLRDFFFDLSPLPDDEDALLLEGFRKVARGVVVGQGLGSAIQGILGGLSFWMAGLSSAILWGTLMAVFAFLPLVGVSAVAIPASIYLYLTGKPAVAMAVLVFNLVQGAIIENIIKTKLIGSAMKMHDLLVFLTVLGGIGTFGLMGLVYGPLLGTFFLTLYELYRTVYRPRINHMFAQSARNSRFQKPG